MFYSKRQSVWMILVGGVILLVGMTLIVQPGVEAPRYDDWAYAWSVKQWLETGKFRITDWSAPSLVLMLWYGAAVSKVAGFSFTVLRLSTLVFTVLGAVSLFGLLCEVGASMRMAALGALTLLLNPIYVDLSYSFMTDVPFTALLLAAVWGYIRGLRTGSKLALHLGSVAVVGSFLVRQFGVLVSIVALVYSIGWQRGNRWRNLSVLPAIAWPLVGFSVFQGWYLYVHGATDRYLYGVGFMQFRLVCYVIAAVFLSGMWWLLRYGIKRWGRRAWAFLGIGGGLGIFALFLLYSRVHPNATFAYFLTRLVTNRMLDDLLVRSTVTVGLTGLFLSPMLSAGTGFLPWIMGLTSAVFFFAWPYGRGMLGQIFGSGLSSMPWIQASLFLIMAIGIRGLFAIVQEYYGRPPSHRTALVLGSGVAVGLHLFNACNYLFFARYILPLLPLLLLALYAWNAKWLDSQRKARIMWWRIGLITWLGFLGVVHTHNEFRVQEKVWGMAMGLYANGVPLNHIDAGQQWDGWYWYQWAREHPEAHRKDVQREKDGWFIELYAPVIEREFIVVPLAPQPDKSLLPKKGVEYTQVKEEKVDNCWLVPGKVGLWVKSTSR